ncbi:MAG TPA: pentapeptide repeat-containing protein, partial [Alphaproteobacteria bacterium]|nr:pentapeptide repeat-containing protein [Alphaproteobacteria bacterium]
MQLTDQIKNRWTGEVMCGGLTLKVVLEQHKMWLDDEEGGKRADLRAADLSDADLRAADLSDANL